MRLQPTSRHGYVASFDGIRAIAIAAVLGAHSGNAPGGIWGVDMFLVLSGYLITGLLYNEVHRSETIAIGRFYGRRMMRLMPAVVATLFVFIAVGFLVLPGAQTVNLWNDAASIFTYSANFWELIRPMVLFGHFWSLSLEEQFYFLWPLLMLVLVGRVSTRKLVWSLVTVVLASNLLGVIWYEAAPSQTAWVMTMLPTRGFWPVYRLSARSGGQERNDGGVTGPESQQIRGAAGQVVPRHHVPVVDPLQGGPAQSIRAEPAFHTRRDVGYLAHDGVCGVTRQQRHRQPGQSDPLQFVDGLAWRPFV